MLREDRDEFVFLVAMGVLILWAYVQTVGFMATSAIVPQFIIYLMAATLVGIFVMKFFGDRIKNKLGMKDVSAGFDFDQGEAEEQENSLSGLYDLNPVGVGKELVWITLYVLAITYVGFFTMTAVFSVAYILVNETSPLPRRAALSVGWTAAIMTVLYVLFVHLLQVSSVWRLGFLP